LIEELLKAKKIKPEQHELYMLFQANELGRKVLDRMTHYAFMEEPQDMDFSGVGFAFYDGRRSVFRDIYRAIDFVNQQLRGINNDGRQQPEQR
jgi:hypothetical protein